MANKTFKKILTICYEENSPELHRELSSIEISIKKTKDYIRGIDDVIEAVSLYADDFSEESQIEIEKIYEEFLDSLEM